MKILITGGAGYGGCGLVEALLKRGHSIRVIDILAPNEAWKIKEFIDKIDYRWKSVHDINDDDLKDIEVVIHMAAQADVPMGFTAPIWTVWQESIGTVAVLEKCRGKNLKKFLLASTGNVIGRPLYIPIDEKHPVVPHNPYSAAKASQEMLVWAYYRAYNIPVAVMRNGIVYGPKMRKQIFLYIWLKNILNNKPIIIEGGEQTRDPCFGSDTIDVWTRMVEYPEDKIVGNTFQVSRGIEWKMEDMAKLCMKVAGKEVPIEYKDYRPGEKGQRECFDNSFAKEQVGYDPKVDLEEGLKILWEWVKKEEKMTDEEEFKAEETEKDTDEEETSDEPAEPAPAEAE
ncbi:MAG: GDP-mannose 4,6-dehydratase [Nanoarchaeota archaeon]|nr:GDP-mannose 4,6-dehydratase [Nanoarchaeota archaeon]